MHFRQKLIFTALGSALTLAGYLLATIVSDVTAQDNKTESLGDIVCDSITVRDGGPIKILDKAHRERTVIQPDAIYVYDKSGQTRATILIDDDFGSFFRLHDKNGARYLSLLVNDDLGGSFGLYDKNGTNRLSISALGRDDSNGLVAIYDKKGTERLAIAERGMLILDESAKSRVSIGYEPKSNRAVMALYSQSKPRILMAVESESNTAALEFRNKSGKYTRAKIAVHGETDEGHVVTTDRNGDLSGYLHQH